MDVVVPAIIVKSLQYACVLLVAISFYIRPKYGLGLFFLLLPLWSLGSISGNYYAGMNFDYVNIVPRTLAIYGIFLICIQCHFQISARYVPVLFLILVYFAIVGLVKNHAPVSILLVVHGLLEPLLLIVTMRICVKDQQDARYVLNFLLVGLVLGILFGFFQLFQSMASGNLLDTLFGWGNPIAQLYGGVPFLASQIALICPILMFSVKNGLFADFIYRRKSALILIMMLCLLMTVKRGPLMLFAILFFLIFISKEYKVLYRVIFVGLLPVIVFGSYFIREIVSVFQHFSSIMLTPKAVMRLDLYRNALDIIKSDFFLGIGMGQYRDPVFISLDGSPLDSPHNLLLHVMAENGLFFLATFLIILFSMILKYLQYRKLLHFDSGKKEFLGIALGIGLFILYSFVAEGEIAHAYHFLVRNGDHIVGVKNSGIIVLCFFYAVLPAMKPAISSEPDA